MDFVLCRNSRIVGDSWGRGNVELTGGAWAYISIREKVFLGCYQRGMTCFPSHPSLADFLVTVRACSYV